MNSGLHTCYAHVSLLSYIPSLEISSLESYFLKLKCIKMFYFIFNKITYEC